MNKGIEKLQRDLGFKVNNPEYLPVRATFCIEKLAITEGGRCTDFSKMALAVCLRYGFDGGGMRTLKEVGRLMDSTVEPARRRLIRAILIIRKYEIRNRISCL